MYLCVRFCIKDGKVKLCKDAIDLRNIKDVKGGACDDLQVKHIKAPDEISKIAGKPSMIECTFRSACLHRKNNW